MLKHVIFLALATVWSVQCWNADVSARIPSTQDAQQPRPIGVAKTPCFGLSRRAIQRKINVPVIYNSRTGQTKPIPRFLYAADENVVSRMENDGWEVRRKLIYVPQIVYERAPICCPWDQNCDQGRQATSPGVMQAATTPGGCANGGQLIYRDGQQRCECGPGFLGPQCQIVGGAGGVQPQTNFPSGPLILVMATPTSFPAMTREQQLWRSKFMPTQGSNPNEMLTSPANSWAYRAAMMQQQNMQAKLAQREAMYRQQNQESGRTMNPYTMANTFSPAEPRSDNPFTSMNGPGQNPYNSITSQGQVPANRMQAYMAAQEEMRQRQAMNPSYSGWPQGGPSPQTLALLQRRNNGQVDVNPYHQRRRQDIDAPQARTPWDLDPFGQQQNPSFMSYPGMNGGHRSNRKALAMALYRQLINLRRKQLIKTKESVNRPQPGLRSPIIGQSGSTTNSPQSGTNQSMQDVAGNVSSEIPTNGEIQRSTAEQLEGVNGESNDRQQKRLLQKQTLPQIPQEQQQREAQQLLQQQQEQRQRFLEQLQQQQNREQQQQLLQQQQQEQKRQMAIQKVLQLQQQDQQRQQLLQQQQGQEQVMQQQQQPQLQQGQQQPSPSEVKKMEQCQAVLTPKLNECLASYALGIDQFMNPEFIQKARAVCAASQDAGQCIMTHDKACGVNDDDVLMTRKMINSVLHMMGVICQQIESRDAPLITDPMQSIQTGLEQSLGTNNVSNPDSMTATQVTSSLTPESPQIRQQGFSELSDTQVPKQTNQELPQVARGAAQSDSKGSRGHDSAHPISMELRVFGYPLWLIVTLGLALFIALTLAVVVICMCCRRCRKKSKVEREIEKVPDAIDNKLYALGLPPPSYRTTVVQQNEDGLSLPPIDLGDDHSISLSDNESVPEKPPRAVDDESNSKKEKKGKKK